MLPSLLQKPARSVTSLDAGIEACAAAAGVPAKQIRIIAQHAHYKSFIVLLGLADEAQALFVLKYEDLPRVRRGGWAPSREFSGLQFAQQIECADDRIGVIHPIAFNDEPVFLVTRYQSGRSMRHVFDAAIARGRDLPGATEYARRLAGWIVRFRSCDLEEAPTFDPQNAITGLSDRLIEIERVAPRRLRASNILKAGERCIEAMQREDAAPAHAARPRHGDFAPQNFLIDGEDRIYAFDFAGFAYSDLDDDSVRFRMRLEESALRGLTRTRRTCCIWQAFFDHLQSIDHSPNRLTFSYLSQVVARMAWLLGDERRSEGRAPRRLTTRIRERLWLHSRFRWLASFPVSPPDMTSHLRNTL